MNNPYSTKTESESWHWRDDAACLGMGDAWFPEDTGNSRDAVMARRICSECPVQNQCLQYALDTKQHWGIWGGLTQTQRRRMSRKSFILQAADHEGSRLEYNRHIANGTMPCRPCRRAHALHTADRRRYRRGDN